MAGFMKSLEKAVTNIAQDVTRQVDHITKDMSREVDKVWSSPILDNFKTGNVVQLVSRSSGFCLQIVMAPTGYLVVDGMGVEGDTVYNTHWTVINEGKNAIRLHNNHNYLAVVKGATVIGNFPPPVQPGPETRFRVGVHGTFVTFDSIAEPGHHIGILNNGQLKSALATGQEFDADFAPKIIFSPHGPVKKQGPSKK